jgi:hypothetical protein
MHFSSQLQHLKISNVVKVRDLLRVVWPRDHDDEMDDSMDSNDPGYFPCTGPRVWPSLGARCPDLPWFGRLETIHIEYGTLQFDPEFAASTGVDAFEENPDLVDWRQSMAIAGGRLAWHMLHLRSFVLAQRPLMWAGKHTLSFRRGTIRDLGDVYEQSRLVEQAPTWARLSQAPGLVPDQQEVAILLWHTTAEFTPRRKALNAWRIVARRFNVDFRTCCVVEEDWRTDGDMPSMPSDVF